MSDAKLLLVDTYSSGEVALNSNQYWVRREDFEWHMRQQREAHACIEDNLAAKQAEHARGIGALRAEVSGLRAARIAYANEFPMNADGEPDVGNIHANIRLLKARAERLTKALLEVADHMAARAKWEPCDCGCPNASKPVDAASVAWIRAAGMVRATLNPTAAQEGDHG